MALIYVCDKCGNKHEVSGIVDNLHKQHEFEQLSAPINGIKDVCKACFREITVARAKAEVEREKTVRERMKELLSLS